jgi:hypothetical protein
MRIGSGRVSLELAGRTIDLPLFEVAWSPGTSRPLRVTLESKTASWELRPIGGYRVLPDWSRMLGAPRPLEDAHADPSLALDRRAQRRRDTRMGLVVDAWIDELGRVPDPALSRLTHTVEVAMSSVVVRWEGALQVGHEVGLALGVGGAPIATRARVARFLGNGLWALEFVSPPGALVHRIGTRVREHERQERGSSRSEYVPLTVGG